MRDRSASLCARLLPTWFTVSVTLVMLSSTTVVAQPTDTAERNAPEASPVTTGQQNQGPAQLPYIRIDRAAHTVDILATVVTREADWLELLACTEGTREYEALLATKAQPSHIHLALLLLGFKPGHPIGYKWEGQVAKVIPPAGEPVTVTLLVPKQVSNQPPDDQQSGPAEDAAPDAQPTTSSDADASKTPVTSQPAEPRWPALESLTTLSPSHWIRNQVTGNPLPDATWLFTGSRFREIPAEGEHQARRIYEADISGSALSLVNFGDDLLARSTLETNKTDDAAWQAVPENMPPRGTQVIIRLSPVAAEDHEDHDKSLPVKQ